MKAWLRMALWQCPHMFRGMGVRIFKLARFRVDLPALCLILLLGAFLVQAEAASFLQRPGLRARGMGGAFAAVADDGSAGAWNPAGVGQLLQSEVTAMAGRLFLGLDRDRLSYAYLSYVEPLPIGAVGFSGAQFASQLYKESQLMLTFSQKLGSLYLGANLKGLFTSLAENEYTAIDPLFQQQGLGHNTWGLDLGMLWRASENFAVALAVSDVNRPGTALDPEVDVRLPIAFRVGVSLGRHLALDVSYRAYEIHDQPDWNLHLGTEWWLGDRVALRAGINRDELAGGASVVIPYGDHRVRLDYAIQYPLPTAKALQDTWGTHLLAVSVRFGRQRSIPREWGGESAAIRSDVQPRATVGPAPGEGEPAIEEMRRKISEGRADKKIYEQMAEYYRTHAELEKAALIYEQASQRYPDDLALLYELGRIYERLADVTYEKRWLEKAARIYQQIFDEDRDYEDVALRLMNVRIRQGKTIQIK